MVPMLPIYSGDLVFFYFPCWLDPCMSLLGSSLFSRFSGIVNCRLDFFCFMCKRHLWENAYDVCLSGLPHSIYFLDPFAWKFQVVIVFFCCVVLHCVNVPHFPYPFFNRGVFRLFPGSGYDKQCYYEHSWAHVLVVQLSILGVYTQRILNRTTRTCV